MDIWRKNTCNRSYTSRKFEKFPTVCTYVSRVSLCNLSICILKYAKQL